MPADTLSGPGPVNTTGLDGAVSDPPAGATTRDTAALPGSPENDHDAASKARVAKLAETFNTGYAQSPYSALVLAGMARLAEFLAMCASGLSVYSLYVQPGVGHQPFYIYTIGAIALAAIVIFQSMNIYTITSFRHPVTAILKITSGWVLAFLIAMAGIFFLKKGMEFSRIWLLGWFVFGWLAIIAIRLVLSAVVRSMTRRGHLDKRAVIVGGGPAAERLLNELQNQKDSNIKIYGAFDDRSDYRSPDVLAGFPKLGNVDDLVEFARRTQLDIIIFSLPITAERRLLSMLQKLWVLPIDIRLAAHSNKLRFRPRSYSYIGDLPVLAIFDKPMAGWDVLMKMTFDRIVGALCLILFSPLMLLIALAIKLDSPGPVLFRQKRHGFNNQEVEIFKFRSMYTNKLDYEAKNLVKKDDPRVTRVGRFIRKTSIDELPQLLNVVFKGDVSLVGPRPHAVHAMAANQLYDEVVDGYFARHRVRPGMTGWAQVNGWRGETDTPDKLQQRVEHDLYYIENWSMLFDLYILAITPFALTKTENAY